jgi:hypothetical protein
MEVIENEMYLYGDTWDSAEAIANQLYAAGVAPGTVTPADALQYMTGIATAAATTSTVVLSEPSTWPWYYWAAGAGAVLLIMSSNKKSSR